MGFGVGLRHRRWTQHERSQLRALAGEGVLTRAIGRVLGRSALAIRIMASRLGIPLRSPVGRPRRQLFAAPTAAAPSPGALTGPLQARFARFLAAEAAFSAAAGVVQAATAPVRPGVVVAAQSVPGARHRLVAAYPLMQGGR